MKELARWRIVVATLWFVAAASTWFVVRVDEDLHVCRTTTTEEGAVASVETERNASGKANSTKTTETPATSQSSIACEPLSIGELAVLLIPSLLLVAPALKSINIAGLLGFDLREFQEKVAAQAQEQVVRVILQQEVGARTEQALTQAEQGEVFDLTPRS